MRYKNATMKDWIASCDKSKLAKAQAVSAIEGNLNCIMIGGVGTGKTMLANCMSNSVDVGTIVTCSKIARIYREHVIIDNKKESELIADVVSYDFFAIDEIGAYKLSDFEYRHINEIIDIRYEQKKPTCLISNLDINGIKNLIGERAVDRLRQGGCLISFDWKSKR